jgi:hypothetical protein
MLIFAGHSVSFSQVFTSCLDQPNRRIRDPYVRWCGRGGQRWPVYAIRMYGGVGGAVSDGRPYPDIHC